MTTATMQVPTDRVARVIREVTGYGDAKDVGVVAAWLDGEVLPRGYNVAKLSEAQLRHAVIVAMDCAEMMDERMENATKASDWKRPAVRPVRYPEAS